MIKSKRQMFIIISVFTLVIMLGTVTYAFFNYTRTGSANNFSVGRIFFKSDNEETITLSNLFPIDPENSTDMADPTKVGTYSIDITGDTDYVDGLEYLVSIVDSNISNLPISIDVSVSNGLGTSNANYFTARESKNASIYKKLIGDTIVGDGMVLVGYVKPNTTSGVIEGVDGTITITAYLDKNKILISDTYDGTESDNMGTPNSMAEGKTVISTADWNSLSTNGISFKIRVEANEEIWVNESLEMIMKRNAVMDNISSTYVSASTGIDFSKASSDSNGKGVYIRTGTENDDHPILYYRGNINNNNIIFANQCWKAVRTTSDGGVKLLYNGTKKTDYIFESEEILSDSDVTYTNDTVYPFSYDQSLKQWTSTLHTSYSESALTFSVKENGYYAIDFVISSSIWYSNSYIIVNNEEIDVLTGEETGRTELYYLTTNDVVKVTYYKYENYSDGSDNVKFKIIKYTNILNSYDSCNNIRGSSGLNNDGTIEVSYNYDYSSMSSVGYMYGTSYSANFDTTQNGAYFGNSVIYSNGEYQLISPKIGMDATHHYTCNMTSAEGTCNSVRYYYYYYSTEYQNYITLTNGDTLETAIEKMFQNINDSHVKEAIDEWYYNNLESYTNRLEDSIWCNDRSISDLGGWNPNGTTTTGRLIFGGLARYINNQFTLNCPNKRDSFTVKNSNGNQKLTYPIGLITTDESYLSGMGSDADPIDYYLRTDYIYWTNSPHSYKFDSSYGSTIYQFGPLGYAYVDNGNMIRPMITIKPNQLIKKGTGLANDPYVIE